MLTHKLFMSREQDRRFWIRFFSLNAIVLRTSIKFNDTKYINGRIAKSSHFELLVLEFIVQEVPIPFVLKMQVVSLLR